MRTKIQQYATYLLAVFTVGGLLLPFAHELTHVRSLEHRHGQPAADLSRIAVGLGGLDAVDFLVEERTVPHNPNCDLCARLTLCAPPPYDAAAPAPVPDDQVRADIASWAAATLSSRQIRAPPAVSLISAPAIS